MIKRMNLVNNELVSNDYLNENLSKLLEISNFDVAKLITFRKNGKAAIISKTMIRDNNVLISDLTEYINLGETKTLLPEIVKSKTIIYHEIDDLKQYHPLTGVAKMELYIPMFYNLDNSKFTYGCIYFASTSKDVDIDIFKTKVFEQKYTQISSIYQLELVEIIMNEFYVNFTNLISEITHEREPHMVNHPYKVANYAMQLGQMIGLSEKKLKTLYMAAIFHDVGKLLVNDSILNKESQLTDEEVIILQKHTIYSYNILGNFPSFDIDYPGISTVVKYHHERYDGKGYPEGLKGDEIPLLSRIICIANSVDTMLSPTVYEIPRSLEEVIQLLQMAKGKNFDPKLCDAMIKILKSTQNDVDNIFNRLKWCTLNLHFEDKVKTVSGTIIKSGDDFVFTSDRIYFEKDLRVPSIKKILLYADINGKLLEFNTKIEDVKENRLYLSNVELVESDDYFSMTIQTQGKIYYNNDVYSVSIYKLGGSSVSFAMNGCHLDAQVREHVVKLMINLGDEIAVSGKIINESKVGVRYFYELRFIDIPESVRDKIIKKLFETKIRSKK